MGLFNLKSSQMSSHLFPLHFNTYVMGVRTLQIFYSFSLKIDKSRVYLDVKDGHRAWGV